MRYRPLLLIFLMLLIVPSVFSQFSLSLLSESEGYENSFYISKNVSTAVYFTLSSDFSSSLQNNYRVEYDLSVYSDNLKELFLSLSKKEDIFLSNVNSSLALNIRSLDFKNQVVNLKVKAILYDSLGNFVDDDYVFLKLVSNNSEYDFPGVSQKKVPDYSGYSLSRDKMVLMHRYDKDLITIKNHISFIDYGVECFSDEKGLLLDLRYQGNNIYFLEASIDTTYEIEKGFYTINCFSFYKDVRQEIKPISLTYLDQNTSFTLLDSEPLIEEEKNEKILKVFFNSFFKKLKG